jgi:hypothetical protein
VAAASSKNGQPGACRQKAVYGNGPERKEISANAVLRKRHDCDPDLA